MDLWHYKRDSIDTAVKTLAIKRGLQVKKVYGLTTGLWITAELNDGRLMNFCDYELSLNLEDLKK